MELTELQEQWLQALESGKYAQTQQMLCNDIYSAFCCLGVACQLAKERGIIEEFYYGEEFPDNAVTNAFGLIRTDGFVPSMTYEYQKDHGTLKLSTLNDDEGLDFPAIAAKIRAHPKDFFANPEPTVPPTIKLQPSMQPLTELQERWLQALESGEYQQGREQLVIGKDAITMAQKDIESCSDPEYENEMSEEDKSYWLKYDADKDAYCCMGVMCQLALNSGLIEGFKGSAGYPPAQVDDLFGIIINDEIHLQDNETKERKRNPFGTGGLANLNDQDCLSFAQIAAEVRAHPERYFRPPSTDDTTR